MNPPAAGKLRSLLSHGNWDRALAQLERIDPVVAADLFMSLPFEEQQTLFRLMPIDFAAKLAGVFPYYHTYVLLHTRPVDDLNAIVDLMSPDTRMQFIDELPAEAWQRLMDELHTPRETAAAAVPERGV